MEEKERYEETDIKTMNFINIYDNEKGTLNFLSTKAVCDLLNQYYKRIKELEEQTYPAYKREHKRRAYLENIEVPRLEKENQQLKQQLHDLPKKIVEEIKEWIKSQIIYCGGKANEVDILIANASNQVSEDLQNILDTILKKYGGEDE